VGDDRLGVRHLEGNVRLTSENVSVPQRHARLMAGEQSMDGVNESIQRRESSVKGEEWSVTRQGEWLVAENVSVVQEHVQLEVQGESGEPGSTRP
jgi:hypothetical protein